MKQRKIHETTEKEPLYANRKFHVLMETSLALSAFLGVYLLATDRSIWILAPSHAYGLIIIVALDLILAALDYSFLNRFYTPSIALAVLTIILQLGDILTASQFRMTSLYFASYLFGLWPYDALLLTQSVIIITGILVRKQLPNFSTKPTDDNKRITIPYSRRNFLVVAGTVAFLAIVGTTIGLASKGLQTIFGLTRSEQTSSSSTTSALESTALAASSTQTSTTQTEEQTSTTAQASTPQTEVQTSTATQNTRSETTSYETQQDAVTTPSSETTTLTSTSSECTESSGSTSYLSLGSGAIANASELQTLSPVYFEYPSGNPGVLLKLSDGTVTALILLCSHLCCMPEFQCSTGEFHCPCHFSKYDSSGNVLQGPAKLPLPKIELTIDSSGNIFPKGISGSSPCLLFVNASASPTSGTAPLTVDFTASLSGGVPPFNYSWAFADGGSSAAQNPSYTYSNDGTFTATIHVNDSVDNTASASVVIRVTEVASTTTTTNESASLS